MANDENGWKEHKREVRGSIMGDAMADKVDKIAEDVQEIKEVVIRLDERQKNMGKNVVSKAQCAENRMKLSKKSKPWVKWTISASALIALVGAIGTCAQKNGCETDKETTDLPKISQVGE